MCEKHKSNLIFGIVDAFSESGLKQKCSLGGPLDLFIQRCDDTRPPLGRVMWQQIIVDGGKVVAGIPVEWWLLSTDLYSFSYFPFL